METNTLFTKDDMVRKVAALLNTAESFALQGNDEAASAYVQKAHTLQQKYSIEQAHLQEATGQKVEQIISRKIMMPGKYGKSKVNLAHQIAKSTQCTGYFMRDYSTTPKGYIYVAFGFESDVDHVEYLVNSLAQQADTQLDRVKDTTWDHGKSFAVSFYHGFTNTIGYRLRDASRQATQEYDADHGTTSTALVLVSKAKQVEAEMRAKVKGLLGKGTPTTSNSYNGYNAGREAGSRATISRGAVTTNSRGALNR